MLRLALHRRKGHILHILRKVMKGSFLNGFLVIWYFADIVTSSGFLFLNSTIDHIIEEAKMSHTSSSGFIVREARTLTASSPIRLKYCEEKLFQLIIHY